MKGESPKTASGAALQPGLLVAFKKDERTELGLVLQPDGKKNWWIANQVSIHCGNSLVHRLKQHDIISLHHGLHVTFLQCCTSLLLNTSGHARLA